MENKHQILHQPNPPEPTETEVGCQLPCSSEPAINRSPDQLISPSVDTERCRECVGALAHRMAQPMTALRGGIELGLMGKRTAADYRALLEQSLQLADTMVQMIVSLRDLGESGAPGGRPDSVLLKAALEELRVDLEALAQSRDLRLELNSGGDSKVHADPERLREVLLNLFAWVIQNSACGGPLTVKTSVSDGMARVYISPPRLDLQYLQIKMLEDISSPGVLISHASKQGALGWVTNQRALEGLGAKLDVLPEGSGVGAICVSLPLAATG